ncbi:hypothetical protein D3OALGA1CA_3740 [Olavius algarvensis associated proteobacterium Delta 3]|nr:hypothetical protein D3OALGA1CA_3740 [Olavius algarvensis associated proteobacterium Delta 3]
MYAPSPYDRGNLDCPSNRDNERHPATILLKERHEPTPGLHTI